jgi:hypothetical protein
MPNKKNYSTYEINLNIFGHEMKEAAASKQAPK